jgi:hypothetical protein
VPVISITAAAQLNRLHPWQVKHICQKYRLVPVPPQTGQDRRCKWFPRDLLLSLIQRERALPLAS